MTMIEMGCTYPEFTSYTRVYVSLYFFAYVAGVPNVQLAMVTIKLKSTQDILQGINKLDYLLKVSIFQKYKDKSL